jgi:hypothetical protein
MSYATWVSSIIHPHSGRSSRALFRITKCCAESLKPSIGSREKKKGAAKRQRPEVTVSNLPSGSLGNSSDIVPDICRGLAIIVAVMKWGLRCIDESAHHDKFRFGNRISNKKIFGFLQANFLSGESKQ